MAATKAHPVSSADLHPLAVAEAEVLSGGDRRRWRVESDRCVLIVNHHGWKPRKQRKAR